MAVNAKGGAVWRGLWRQPLVWGEFLEDLTTVYVNPAASGLLRPQSPIETLVIRPAWGSDHRKIEAVRRGNRSWLEPWEATLPPGSQEEIPTFDAYRRRVERQMQEKESLLMVIEADEEVAGIVSVAGVQHGAMSQGNLGYWIGERWAGQGVTSLAVATVMDLLLLKLGLHRLEVNVRPENGPSLGLCRTLGLRHEGLRKRYMCIAGEWADHEAFAIDVEMLPPGGLVEARLRSRYA